MSRRTTAWGSRSLRDGFGGLMLVLAFGLVLGLVLAPRQTFVGPLPDRAAPGQGGER